MMNLSGVRPLAGAGIEIAICERGLLFGLGSPPHGGGN